MTDDADGLALFSIALCPVNGVWSVTTIRVATSVLRPEVRLDEFS
jgi:hypothetical protein